METITQIQANELKDLINLGEIDKAESIVIEYLSVNDLDPFAIYYLALCYYYNKSYKIARDLAMTSISIKDDVVNFYLLVIECCFKGFGTIGEAKFAISKAVELSPNNLNLRIKEGFLFGSLGEHEKSFNAYSKALEIDPANVSAKYFIKLFKEKDGFNPDNEYIEDLFDSYSGHYDQHMVKILKTCMPSKMYDLYKKYKENGQDKILDLGCGTGLLASYFNSNEKNLVFYGVDISEKMLKYARAKKIYKKLEKNSIQNYLKESNDEFNIILAGDVFSYIFDLKEIFMDVYKILANKGLFLFSIENSENNKKYTCKKSGRIKHSKDEIANLLSETGFIIEDSITEDLRMDGLDYLKGDYIIARKRLIK